MFFFSLISLVTTWGKKNEAVLRKVGTVRNGGEWRKSEGFSGYKQTPVFQTSLCSRGCRQGLGRELWSLAVWQCSILQLSEGVHEHRGDGSVGPSFYLHMDGLVAKSLMFPSILLYEGQGK